MADEIGEEVQEESVTQADAMNAIETVVRQTQRFKRGKIEEDEYLKVQRKAQETLDTFQKQGKEKELEPVKDYLRVEDKRQGGLGIGFHGEEKITTPKEPSV